MGFFSVRCGLPLRQLWAFSSLASPWCFLFVSSTLRSFDALRHGLSLRRLWAFLLSAVGFLSTGFPFVLRLGLVSSCGARLFVLGSSLRVGLFSSCGALLFAWGSSLRVGLFTLCLGSLLFIVWGTPLSSCGDFLSSCGGFSLRVGTSLFV